MKILSLNAGSNSLKFELVEVQPGTSEFGRTLSKGSYDNIGKAGSTFTLFQDGGSGQQQATEISSYEHAAELLLDWIDKGNAAEHGVANLGEIERIGHRVVHGADLFRQPARIDEEVIRKIESLEELAPLHNASALSVIRAVGKRAEWKIPMIAVFDTLFHQTIGDVAGLYALPVELSRKNKIRRYGFHGISHQYMMLRYGQITGRPVNTLNLVTLHLEGGSSAAAIHKGKSVDTSMGFTPLEGLMMGTRSGDIDAALVPYLMRKEDLDAKGVEEFLNKKCGLLGVSGVSADTRELGKQTDNPDVRLALAMFSYRVRKYVGAYVAALGGAEAVVFGGGIGENTPSIREEICKGLECMGIRMDREVNKKSIDREAMISTADSPVKIWVVPTQEALMVAYQGANWSEAAR